MGRGCATFTRNAMSDRTDRLPTALSFGGGVNSTALLLELVERGYAPDVVLFSDTGGEKPSTYRHVDEMEEWCLTRRIPFVRVSNASRGQGDTLEENCLQRKELPSLAYGFKGCSVKWKRQPMDRWLRSWEPARQAWADNKKVLRVIGIDASEAHRATLTEDKLYRYSYPLVNWQMGRDECIASIQRHGLRVPEKSSCFFCPAMRKHEIIELQRQHPDLAARALALEANAVTHSVAGLGRNWKWRDLLETDRRQMKLFPEPPGTIPCGCHDGESEDE